MSLLDIPYLNGYKTAIAGWGLFLIGISNLALALGNCLSGDVSIAMCITTVQDTFVPLLTALSGMGILGIGHKLEKNPTAGGNAA